MQIHLRNDTVKNKGYGAGAELLAAEYAFNTLDMNAALADCVYKNKRGRHMFEKIGFTYVGEYEVFRYYRLDRAMRYGE